MIRLCLYAIVIAALSWAGGLLWFTQQIPHTVPSPEVVTDGIVVLTGGSNRLHTGIRLLREGKAKKLLISGVGKDTTLDDLKTLEGISDEEFSAVKDRITLGYLAKNTKGNAEETAIWMALEKFNSIRLVTANYHIPRSMLEFSKALPGKTIIAHPVIPANVETRVWWRFPGSAHLVISEYHKFLGAWVHQIVF